MPPRKTKPVDPRLQTPQWNAIRTHWRDICTNTPTMCQATHCYLPGIPILTGTPRGPAHLDVGHIIPRAQDPRPTWTIQDTRPEHQRCGRTAGTHLGNKRTATRKQNQPQPPNTQNMTITNDNW